MGKGDNRRATQVDDASFTIDWCATFGHKMRETSEWCINCFKSAKQLEEEKQT